VELRGLEPRTEPGEMALELRFLSFGAVTRMLRFLRICVGVLRDVTVLDRLASGTWRRKGRHPLIVRVKSLSVRLRAEHDLRKQQCVLDLQAPRSQWNRKQRFRALKALGDGVAVQVQRIGCVDMSRTMS
jgi:hypothetical protein